MKTLNEVHLAYIAGFFDGEGSITIHENGKPSPRGLSPNHTLQVSVGNTDPIIVRWLHDVYGGGFSVRPGIPGCRTVYQWTCRAAKALPFLLDIAPYVRMKQKQVALAIEFQRSKRRGPKLVSPQTVAWRQTQRAKLRALNNRGGLYA